MNQERQLNDSTERQKRRRTNFFKGSPLPDKSSSEEFRPAPRQKNLTLRPAFFAVGVLALQLVMPTEAAFGQNANDAFDPNVNGFTVDTIAVQNDGKIIIGGIFTGVGGIPCTNIARVNVDGTVDPSFISSADYRVNSLAVQEDGKILVGGEFINLSGQPCSGIGRLNANGSLDNAFKPDVHGSVSAMAVQRDGKILVGGNFDTIGGQPHSNLGRLNADGSVDTNFNSGSDNYIESLALQADGKILVAGWFTTLGGQTRNRLGRLNVDGSLDTSFSVNTTLGPASLPGEVFSVALQPDGKAIIGGYFDSVNDVSRTNIARLNSDGSLDTSFDFDPAPGIYGFISGVLFVTFQPDGKMIIGHDAYSTPTNIIRLNPDGTLDAAFRAVLGQPFSFVHVNSIAVQPDGKVLIGGSFTSVNGVARWHVARLIGGIAPVITLQPQSQSVTAGDNVAFTVAVTGDAPLSYQWRKDGVNLTGKTGPSVTLNNVQKSDEGLYSVVVSNAFGSVISSNATLRVERPDPVALVERLRDVVNAQAARPQPLNATLTAALASIGRGNPTGAIHQLQAFENKVRAQIQPLDQTLVKSFIRMAEDIIAGLSGL